MTRPRLLVVQHQDDCPPSWVGDRLARRCDLDVRRPDRGESLHRDGADGVLVLGGSPNAHQDERAPWLPAVRALCADCLADGTPLLGICLGHQLIAVAVGARSVPNPRGQQLGVLRMGWTDAAGDDPLVQPRPAAGVQWNTDVVVDLPATAIVLARTARDEVQAVRYGPAAWGLQCHPEADAAICRSWVEGDREGYASSGADVEGCLAAVRAAEPELVAAWTPVVDRFAGVVTAGRVPTAVRPG